MDQGRHADTQGDALGAASAVLFAGRGVPEGVATDGGRQQYVPVIGPGPLPAGGGTRSAPLVPAPLPGVPGAFPAESTVADGAVSLTASGHAVPEFLAGVAHLTQLLSAQFPHTALPEQSLGETVGAAQALVQAAQSLLTMATAEAVRRGLPAQSGHSVADWVTTWAPLIDRPEALATARIAQTMDDELLGTLGAKITDGTTRVARANIVARFAQEMAPIADRESLEAVVTTLTDHVETFGTRELHEACKRARVVLKPAPDDDEDEAKLAGKRLLRRVGHVAGLAEWQLLLDEEAEAILEAALDPLTTPRPSADRHGLQSTDPRTASQRRGDALVEILTRAASTDDSDAPTSGAGRVQITTSLDALRGEVAGGGHDDRGHHLSPGALRRLACDADIFPVVLGGPSEPLDVGRVKRLFTPGQRRAVYLRDRHCTFPGCTIPVAWCQIHHVLHWVFGGHTDLLNAAALCQRHHTVVHRYGYTADVSATTVTWRIPRPFSATGFD